MLTAALDWGAVVLPTFLAIALTIAGVLVSLETPHLRSRRAKWAARSGLLAFGLLASVLIALQQKYSRDETAELKGLFGTIADAVKVDRSGSARSVAEAILNKLPSADWRLTAAQKQKLGEILDSAPPQSRFSIDLRVIAGNAQAQKFRDELAAVFLDHHWTLTAAVDPGIRADLVGLYIAISPDIKSEQDVPTNARILAGIFEQSNIPFKVGSRAGVAKDAFQLDIGTAPAE